MTLEPSTLSPNFGNGECRRVVDVNRRLEELSGRRGNLLPLTFAQLAGSQLLGVDPAHLSRVENGKLESLGVPADRLARLLTVVTGGRRVMRGIVGELADAGTQVSAVSAAFVFRWDGDRKWKRAA